MNAIYLDHQATSTLEPGVLEAMLPVFSETYGNPHSSDHAFGWRSADAVDAARAAVAAAVGYDPDEVVFTSGATEANNLAILGYDKAGFPRVITATTEHKSVIAAVRERARLGSDAVFLPVDHRGVLDIVALEKALQNGPALVSVMAVNNEIGTVQPLAAVADLCRRYGSHLHVDAAQALAFGAFDVSTADADFVSLSSHKAGGPMGIGALVVARHSRHLISPLMFGGGQEDGLRPGTVPTPLVVGFGAACVAVPTDAEILDWRLRTERLAGLLVAEVPGLTRNGGGDGSHPGNLSVTLPQGDAHAVIARLQPGLAVSTGSACTSGTPEPSHVLRAIGLDAASAERTIRLSVGRSTTIGQIEEAARAVGRAVAAANV